MRSGRLILLCFLLFSSGYIKAQTIPSWNMTDVVSYFSKRTDTVYVINFWATFCKPCVAEIPFLQSISQKYADQKVKLLLVSLDLPNFYPGKIADFAVKNNINADIVWLNETNADHFCPMIDKKWGGSIPATIFIHSSTAYKKFFEEEMKPDQFEEELKKAIGIYDK